jgi:hypothetical protein
VLQSTRNTRVALACVIALALSGCGSGRQTTTSAQAPVGSSTSSTASAVQTRLTTTVRYADEGILLEPPPPDAAPVTTALQALAKCLPGLIVCESSPISSVQLALVTLTKTGTAAPDGTLIPAAVRQLVWAMTWTGVTCSAPAGPVGLPDPSVTKYPSCTTLTLIDAQTGNELYAVSGPNFSRR